MKKIVDALKTAKSRKLDSLGMPALPKEFILKNIDDSDINSRIVTYFDPKSPITEQYRRLREHLKTLSEKDNLKVIAISSAVAGEGKTITALNLAVAMSKDIDCKSVLLVDCDLRRGKIEKSLGMKEKTGLSDYLLVNAEVENIIYKTKIKKLSIIQKGKSTDEPSDLLASSKMKTLLKRLKEKFDVIILDAPPIIPVADSAAVGAMADGVVMVIQAGKTQRGVVKHAAEFLGQAKANLIGYVLTHLEYYIPEYIYKHV